MTNSITHVALPPYKDTRLSYARFALYTAGISAILASICCLGPFLLVTLGLSSAWILYLITLADWSRPFFILLALATLLFSYQIIWGSIPMRTTEGVCLTRKEMVIYKAYFLFVVLLVVAMFMLPYFAQSMGLIIK